MKKVVVICTFLVTSVMSGFAQFKVDSEGWASFGPTSPNNVVSLNVYRYVPTMQGYTESHYGFVSDLHALNRGFRYGVRSIVRPTSTAGTNYGQTVGVYGKALGGQTNYNFGLLGQVQTTGAAVYGTTNGYVGSDVGGLYAGYFVGDTKVEGTLTATNVVTPSDITLKENVKTLADVDDNTLSNVMDMNVITYNYKDREIRYLAKDSIRLEQEAVDIIKEPIKQLHYGLSAQELKEIYPDLVHKAQDGTLGVNYIELVPILIRSIQELKQELDTRTKTELEARTRGIAEEVMEVKTPVASTGNILYQNTPNPFKEQTVIRFSLADDAKDAAICIFDLSGKMLRKMPVTPSMTSVSVGGYELGEGMFLYTLMVNGQEINTKRMIITK